MGSRTAVNAQNHSECAQDDNTGGFPCPVRAQASVVPLIRFDNGMLQGPPHPRAPRSPRPPRGGWILLPSPLWGRGWRASGVIASRGGPGEGVSPIVNSYVGHHTSCRGQRRRKARRSSPDPERIHGPRTRAANRARGPAGARGPHLQLTCRDYLSRGMHGLLSSEPLYMYPPGFRQSRRHQIPP